MVNFDGALLEGTTSFLNHKNRAFQFGDVLFEELRVIHGKPIFWEEHYFRLMASMRILRMEIPMEFTLEYLWEQIQRTLEANALRKAPSLVKLTVFRTGEFEIQNAKASVSYLLEASSLESPFYIFDEGKLEVELFKDYLVNRDMLSNLSTNNEVIQVVADIYAKENGYDNCILLNTDKQVVGTARDTIFLVKEKLIKTPALSDGAKNTVFRRKLIEILTTLDDYQVQETAISPFELQKADELFITNIARGVQSITKYRKKEYTNNLAKEVLGKLNAHARLASLG